MNLAPASRANMCPLIISRVALLEVQVYIISTTLSTTPAKTKFVANDPSPTPSFPVFNS